MSGRVDVHNHLIPPRYQARLDERGLTAGGLQAPAWSEDLALAAMDAHGVETAVVSVSTPGVHLGDDAEARETARQVNEYAAELVGRHPGRFGFFASVTLPDVEGALAETAYAFDELHADGLILLANVGGRHLGDPEFEPLLAELDRRRAVVFVHPSTLPGPAVGGIPPYIADFLLDTTRTAVSLVRADALRRHPGITFILSHGGGFLPFAAHRLAMTSTFDSDRTVEDFLADLASFRVDTAQTSSPTSLPAVLEFFGADQVFFGTDWPHASDSGVAYFTRRFAEFDLDDATRRSIECDNARALLPRFTTPRA
ncbi:amidohydrolase family protein [Pseudonocardia sp. WMMC193]|uniref:amidohydrolase family protein n=1 Tax=Pseudonocardia sp. WMMC193 TaxID=2911965 RepID=UPI001F1A580F|nr:amidohydrolase family protein [Pseudonocardia sp. WMMC193]MCF7553639.1 amidohydrolase [Pseudonocardia sp. WMMC193]